MSSNHRARLKKLERFAAAKAARNRRSVFHYLLDLMLEEITPGDVPRKDRPTVMHLYRVMVPDESTEAIPTNA